MPDGRPAELADLDRFSALIGRDPEQVQAAGGNTSLKADGILWVKASGLWLADALARDVFVPVRLDEVLAGVAADIADPVGPAVIGELNPGGLRPSIETTLHALLPHRVVVHTHSVRTLAFAIREDGPERLTERLDGLAWAFVPYRKPGLPLTRDIAAILRDRPGADVLVLGSHGLVVGAATVDAAVALLAEVERRLEAPALLAPAPDRPALAHAAAALGLREVAHDRAHTVATDPRRTARAIWGSLYPDHVIFLGPAAVALPTGDADATATVEAATARGAKLFVLSGAGLLLPRDAIRSADELALCLALVLERVPDEAALRRLTPGDEADLLDWDAEKYRQALAGARVAG